MPVAFRPKLIWITRSSPYGHRAAKLFRRAGFRAFAIPVLETGWLPVDPPAFTPEAIVFAGGHGIRGAPSGVDWGDVPVFALGEYTPDAVFAAGYRNAQSASDPRDLVRRLEARLCRGARILVFGARPITEDLGDALHRFGFEVERVNGYRTRPSTDLELRDALEILPEMDGICVYSPRGARRVAELIVGRSLRATIFCLSQPCADAMPATGEIRIEVAERPSDQGLLELVRRRWALRSEGSSGRN